MYSYSLLSWSHSTNNVGSLLPMHFLFCSQGETGMLRIEYLETPRLSHHAQQHISTVCSKGLEEAHPLTIAMKSSKQEEGKARRR